MLKQQGFTLIELVIVIVVLGILATVAAPKFINLSKDARISTLQKIQAALSSTSLLVEMKAKIEGIEDGSIGVGDNQVLVNNFYITGHWNNAWRHALDIGKDISYTQVNATCRKNNICAVGNQTRVTGLPIVVPKRGLLILWLKDMKIDDLCYAYYYNLSTGEPPTIGIVDDGC